MENLGVWGFLLLALLSTSFAQDIPKHFKAGGQLELDPKFTGQTLTNIVWKLNGDLVVEWIQSLKILDYYDRFKNRTTLDTTTGRLAMKDLTDADQGTFSVELNHKVQPQRYIAKAIPEVPEPQVVVQPLACHIDSNADCTLRCEGDTTGAEPVTYSWREGDGEWQTGDQNKRITKTGTRHIKEYSCQISNPVSDKASTSIENPFFVEGPPEPGPPDVGLAAGVTFGVILVAAVAGFLGWKFKDQIRQRLSSNRSTANGNKPPSSVGDSASKHEGVPLTDSQTPRESA